MTGCVPPLTLRPRDARPLPRPGGRAGNAGTRPSGRPRGALAGTTTRQGIFQRRELLPCSPIRIPPSCRGGVTPSAPPSARPIRQRTESREPKAGIPSTQGRPRNCRKLRVDNPGPGPATGSARRNDDTARDLSTPRVAPLLADSNPPFLPWRSDAECSPERKAHTAENRKPRAESRDFLPICGVVAFRISDVLVFSPLPRV